MPTNGAILRIWLAALVIAAMLVIAPALSQQRTQEPQREIPPPLIRATTRLVLVDVVVRDGKGNAVTDLTAEDFTVLEDGKEQRLAVFTLEQPARRTATQPAPPPLPPHIYTNRPEFSQPPGPLTILLLDALNTDWPDQAYARLQLLRYAETQLEPGHRVAVLALGRRLYLLQDFTADPEILRATLEYHMGKKGAPGIPAGATGITHTNAAPTLNLSLEMQAAQMQRFFEQFSAFDSESLADALRTKSRITLEAFQSIARATASYTGRKNLIWVSAAFPISFSGENIQYMPVAIQEDLRRTTNLLASAQVTIYPVDAKGLEAFSLVDIGAPLIRLGTSDAERPVPPRTMGPALSEQLRAQSNSRWARHATMKTIAEETGGRAFYDRNDIHGAVSEALDDGSTYYVLGYYPENRATDGRFRSIRVRSSRPGLTLRHRSGYFAPQGEPAAGGEASRVEELERVFSQPLAANQITFSARVPPPEPATTDDLAGVTIQFLVDTGTVASQTAADGAQSFELDFAAAALQPDGTVTVSRWATLTRTLTPDLYRQAVETGLPFQMQLSVPPGRHRLRLVVRDNRTGWTGSLEVPLEVPVPE